MTTNIELLKLVNQCDTTYRLPTTLVTRFSATLFRENNIIYNGLITTLLRSEDFFTIVVYLY